MPQHHTQPTRAFISTGDNDADRFLTHTSDSGYTTPWGPLGHQQPEFDVMCFPAKNGDPADVTLSIRHFPFSLHTNMTAEDARTLAAALTQAAQLVDMRNHRARAEVAA